MSFETGGLVSTTGEGGGGMLIGGDMYIGGFTRIGLDGGGLFSKNGGGMLIIGEGDGFMLIGGVYIGGSTRIFLAGG